MNHLEYVQIRDYLLLESGQYMAPLEATLMTDTHVANIINRELGIYSKYRPHSEELTVHANHLGEFDFRCRSTDPKERDIPIMITNVRIPRGNGSLTAAAIVNYTITPLMREKLVEEPLSNFDYRKPILHLPTSGTYALTAHYSRYFEYMAVGDQINGVIEHISLDEDDLLFKLLLGKFLQYVGRSRRAFTLEGIPVTFDAAEMVSDGVEIYDSAFLQLTEQSSKWYEGVLG